MTKAGVGSKRFPSSITWIDQRSPPAACSLAPGRLRSTHRARPIDELATGGTVGALPCPAQVAGRLGAIPGDGQSELASGKNIALNPAPATAHPDETRTEQQNETPHERSDERGIVSFHAPSLPPVVQDQRSPSGGMDAVPRRRLGNRAEWMDGGGHDVEVENPP